MLPFSSIDYFFIAGIFILWLFISKYLLRKAIDFSSNLLILSIIFLIFYYPKPIHIFLLVFYSYGVYYLFNSVIKVHNKLIGSLILLLPMIIVKSTIKVHYYPFDISQFVSFAGLSYMSFRIVSIYIESNPGSKPVNFFKYLNFLLFTPTLLIGPIDRYNRFLTDLKSGYDQINMDCFAKGWNSLILGIFYKYICAEIVDRYWLSQFNHDSTHLLDMISTMYAYYFYLFFDFAGYSSMAIGVGKMMGINVPINFDKPFIAKNPQDFWRRFHKSLGDWLRDYFFMPFYKFFSRKKKLKPYPLLRQNVALFCTFLLMGCWNGFQANYIISGAIFGIYSVVHNSYIYYSKKMRRDIVFGDMNERIINWISIFIMFNLTAFSIYIFSGRFPFL